eukprot:7379862-Prymnesium_polylepis.1
MGRCAEPAACDGGAPPADAARHLPRDQRGRARRRVASRAPTPRCARLAPAAVAQRAAAARRAGLPIGRARARGAGRLGGGAASAARRAIARRPADARARAAGSSALGRMGGCASPAAADARARACAGARRLPRFQP